MNQGPLRQDPRTGVDSGASARPYRLTQAAPRAGAAALMLVVGALTAFYLSSSAEPERARSVTSASSASARPTPPVIRAGQPGLPQPRVRPAVYGKVQSSTALGIPHARVCALDVERSTPRAECVFTDGQGKFTLPAAEAALDMIATARGYLPGRASLSGSARTPFVITLVKGGVTVSGSVLDVGGGVVSGALVTARRAQHEPAVAFTRSDDTGRFELDLAPGEVLLTAEAELYSAAHLTAEAPAQNVLLALAPASTIQGRVLARDGEGVADTTVTASVRAGLAELPSSTRTREDGSFEIAGLSAGAYELRAQAARWRSEVVLVRLGVAERRSEVVLTAERAATLSARIRLEGKPCARGQLTVSGAEHSFATLDGAETVTLGALPFGPYEIEAQCVGAYGKHEKLAIATDAPSVDWELAAALGSLRGRVIGANGNPLGRMSIELEPIGEPRARARSVCTSDERGAFECRGLPRGTYDCAIANGLSEPVRVAVEDGPSSEVLLRALATATLRVHVDAGEPGRSRPPVFARGVDPFALEPRWQDDAYVFERLRLGQYAVYVGGGLDGEPAARATLDYEGQIVSLAIAVPRTVAVTGRVVDARGEPVPDTWVRAFASDSVEAGLGRAVGQASLTDATGAFALHGLAPDTYQLHAAGSFGQARLSQIKGGSAGIRIQLEPLGPVAQVELGSPRALDSEGHSQAPASPSFAPPR
ncbi:MAG TPA: carboxypeptidase-like regulatory domain-containing protein [Polyangiaceae bacterium]|nr:carboxypeptidase-like regulatory domain-containing protein [Polyangiaceae bacterium]